MEKSRGDAMDADPHGGMSMEKKEAIWILRQCKFSNAQCMCQFCEKKCNNGLNCFECERAGEAVHSVYLCTGFEGNVDEYIQNWKAKQQIKECE